MPADRISRSPGENGRTITKPSSPNGAAVALRVTFPSERSATVEEIERADPWILEAYATYLNPPREELYDLSNDPYEFRNLAGDPDLVDIQDRLRATLTQWQVETNDRIADPEILARLTEEHDAALAARYKEGGGADQRRQNDWRYAEYLR